MNADQEKFLKMSGEALRDWRESLGGTAWVILGIVSLALLVLALALARRLWRSSKEDRQAERF